MCDLARPQSESARGETDEPGLKVVRFRERRAGLQQEFELPVCEDIFVGVSGS